MKNIIATIALVLFASTAQADEVQYTLTPVESTCTTTDLFVGFGVGAVSAVVIGITTVAAAPLVGAAGVVGLSGATSGAILTGSTLPAIAASSVLVAPVIGTAGYYASCVTSAVMGD